MTKTPDNCSHPQMCPENKPVFNINMNTESNQDQAQQKDLKENIIVKKVSDKC